MSQANTHKKSVPISIFVAYSRKDEAYLKKLRTYLKPLERRGEVKIWYDGDIEVGSNWDAKIKEHLHQADIILPLISADALASDYFYDVEMKIALDRQAKGIVEIIPIILKTCLWESEPIGELQVLPKDGKPIEKWERESEAYTNVIRGVRERIISLKELRKQNEKVKVWLNELLLEMTKKSYSNAIVVSERILELTPKDELVKSLKNYLKEEEQQKNVIQERLGNYKVQLRGTKEMVLQQQEKIKQQQDELNTCEKQIKKFQKDEEKYIVKINRQKQELENYEEQLANSRELELRQQEKLKQRIDELELSYAKKSRILQMKMKEYNQEKSYNLQNNTLSSYFQRNWKLLLDFLNEFGIFDTIMMIFSILFLLLFCFKIAKYFLNLL